MYVCMYACANNYIAICLVYVVCAYHVSDIFVGLINKCSQSPTNCLLLLVKELVNANTLVGAAG